MVVHQLEVISENNPCQETFERQQSMTSIRRETSCLSAMLSRAAYPRKQKDTMVTNKPKLHEGFMIQLDRFYWRKEEAMTKSKIDEDNAS
jgi:hypothetical protein